MKITNLIKQATLVALCLLITSQANAYERLSCPNGSNGKTWPSATYTINYNPTGFSGAYSHWAASFSVARARFNKGSKFYMSQQEDNDTSIAVSNGESELWWVTTGCSATAYTITSSGTCNTVEGDIHFSNAACVSYEDDMSDKTVYRNYGPGIKRTFETTAIHEVGHTAGLAHENDEYGIMGGDYTAVLSNGSSLRSYITSDMNEGLLAMYGARTNKIKDLSATHWRYATTVAQSGDYSVHERTPIYQSNGTTELPHTNYAGCVEKDEGTGPVKFCERIYTVDQGQVVQAEFLFENIGNDTQTATIGYYLSTTDLITTNDTLLGTQSITLTTYQAANVVKKTLTIPTNLNTNTTYFIGAIIDYNNTLAESDEQNNASYIPIKTSNVGGSSSGGSSSGGSSSGGSSSGGSSSGGSLSNGQTVTGLAAAANQRTANYYIDVPTGATNLVIKITPGSGATGDADLFVKKDSIPTDSSYDCRPWIGGNTETCGTGGTALPTSAGRFHINVRGYSAFTNVNLMASYTAGGSSSGGSSSGGSSSGGSSSGGSSSGGSSSGGSSSGGSSSGGSSSGGSSSGGLSNGQTVTGLAAAQNQRTANYYIDVPTGATNLTISIAAGSGSTGDADLFVKKDSIPTDSSYDCRPWDSGSNETCGTGGDTLATSAGRFHINVRAYSAFTNVNLTASYTAGGSSSGGSSSGGSSSGGSSSGGSSSGGSSSGGSIVDACATEAAHTASLVSAGDAICLKTGTASNSIAYHYIQVPANTSSMTIKTQHGTGNGNLHYNASTWATATSNTQSSTGSGNTESITVSNPATGYRFFSVTGQQAGMALIVELQ